MKKKHSLSKLKDKSDLKLYELQLSGLPTNLLEDFEVKYQLTNKQTANLMGVSQKTYYNLIDEPMMDRERADRFLYINKIFNEGTEAFCGEENFLDWLKTPQPVLDNQKPIDLMSTITGAEAAYGEIIRIKHGVLA